MFKIANRKIIIPNNIIVENLDDNIFIFRGPCGAQKIKIPNNIKIKITNNIIVTESKENMILVGTYNSLIKNIIEGIEKGYEINLKIIGIGYKVLIKKNENGEEILEFFLGKSHSDEIMVPNDLKISLIGNSEIKLFGIDKEKINFFAYKIRSLKLPNKYKLKGIYFKKEIEKIKLKERKKT